MHIKKLLIAVLALILVLFCMAFVACDNTQNIQDMQYALTDDGTGYILVSSNSSGSVVVVDSYNNLPVVGIADLAFSKSTVTSVVIPDSITYIGNSAFWQCDQLAEVTIGNGVVAIGDYAFMDCANLHTITLGSSITSIGQLTFFGCENMNQVYIVGGIDSWLNIDFANLSASPMYCTNNVYLGTTSNDAKLCDITDVVVNSSTTAIDRYAFYNCTSLVSVDLSDSVVTISDYAFDGIETLVTVSGTSSVEYIGDYAFNNCTNIDNFDFGSNLTYIGDSAFCGCSSLLSVYMYDSVTTLGNYAFCNCSSLSAVTLSNSLQSIPDYAFCQCTSLVSLVVPDSVTVLCENALANCTSLVEVRLGSSLQIIENSAFGYCEKLQEIYLPDSVITIADYVFEWCTSLGYADISDSVQTIGRGAFTGCSSLGSIVLGNGITSIGENCFTNTNDSISTMYYNGTVEDWCNIDFASWSTPMHTGTLWYCLDNSGNYQCVTELVISDSISEIKQNAFSYFYQLTSITIGSNVTNINAKAFYNCENVEFLYIDNSVQSIANDVFNGCIALTDVVTSNNLQDIGDYAFYNTSLLTNIELCYGLESVGIGAFSWSGLTNVYIPATVSYIGEMVFDNCSSLISIDVAESNDYYCSIDGNLYDIDAKILYQYSIGSTNTIFTLPSTVSNIYARAFKNANNISQFLVEEGNLHYSAVDGVLYSYNLDTLVYYPVAKSGTTFEVPDTVTTIGEFAFYLCRLQEVTLPNSLTTILSNAFNSCSYLQQIVVPSSVTTISALSFSSCSKVVSISFENSYNWYITTDSTYIDGVAIDLSDAQLNAVYFNSQDYKGDKYYLYQVAE